MFKTRPVSKRQPICGQYHKHITREEAVSRQSSHSEMLASSCLYEIYGNIRVRWGWEPGKGNHWKHNYDLHGELFRVDRLDQHDEVVLLRRKHTRGDAHWQQHTKLPARGPFREHNNNHRQCGREPGRGKILPVGDGAICLGHYPHELPIYGAKTGKQPWIVLL